MGVEGLNCHRERLGGRGGAKGQREGAGKTQVFDEGSHNSSSVTFIQCMLVFSNL